MRGPHNLIRLLRTGATFERTGAMRIALDAMDVHRNLKIAARVFGWPFQWLGLKGKPEQPAVLRSLTALGPAYVKFGQLLSTRPDIVGKDLARELRILQDRLPAFPTAEAKRMVEAELGKPADTLFSEFSEPVAAASIAQVHRARLSSDGSLVAVKVLRPDIERAFQRDIDAFYLAADIVRLLSPSARRLRPRAVIEHFEGVVQRELDLRMEASAADEFAAATKDDPGIFAPAVRWSLSARRMVTLDWVEGINLGDVDGLREAGHDLPDLARRLIQMFLRQALRDGFFHADMHQGNIKISPEGQIRVMDFGIMGRIDEYTRRVYAEILMGFIGRDYKNVARVHFEAGYVPSDQSVDDFAQALRSVGEPIFGMDASRISMARLLAHLFEVTERFGMETRTELILLQRTMVVVEGVARSLDPNMNMWETSKPVVENYIRSHFGPEATLREIIQASRIVSRLGPRLTQLVETAAKRLAKPSQAPPPDRRPAAFIAGAVITATLAIAIAVI
ncbi:MAG: 2-polyprenylphenol 6-hydroxylase [Rhodobacteraceae bacterium]|nr:2-polyprenylphenol 6-hydroxylase [Paracoccaceae bacterium]